MVCIVVWKLLTSQSGGKVVDQKDLNLVKQTKRNSTQGNLLQSKTNGIFPIKIWNYKDFK